MDGGMDVGMDGWMEGWNDGWIDQSRKRVAAFWPKMEPAVVHATRRPAHLSLIVVHASVWAMQLCVQSKKLLALR